MVEKVSKQERKARFDDNNSQIRGLERKVKYLQDNDLYYKAEISELRLKYVLMKTAAQTERNHRNSERKSAYISVNQLCALR